MDNMFRDSIVSEDCDNQRDNAPMLGSMADLIMASKHIQVAKILIFNII